MVTTTTTAFEVVVSVLYGVDMMAGVWAELVIKVDLSNALTVKMTVSEFTMSAS